MHLLEKEKKEIIAKYNLRPARHLSESYTFNFTKMTTKPGYESTSYIE